MKRPLLLDLFCGAGGCAVGYHRVGFDVVGVDIKPQPRYPFKFWQGDAIKVLHNITHGAASHGYDGFLLSEFDVIHASPPCQAYSVGKQMWKGRLAEDRHPDLVAKTRELLIKSGLPYVIENVVGAPVENAVVLCGDMFGLGVKRHRLFEVSELIPHPVPCRRNHPDYVVSVFGGGALSRTPSGGWSKGRGNFMQKRVHVPHEKAKAAMGIDWMTRDELSQAIPPVYTEYIGKQLLRQLEHNT